jgi:hypothetical protein
VYDDWQRGLLKGATGICALVGAAACVGAAQLNYCSSSTKQQLLATCPLAAFSGGLKTNKLRATF